MHNILYILVHNNIVTNSKPINLKKEGDVMKKNKEKREINVDKVKENIVKLQQIDKNLIPQYLDNTMQNNNIKTHTIKNGEENSFLKYML